MITHKSPVQMIKGFVQLLLKELPRDFTQNKIMGKEQVGKEKSQLQVKDGHQNRQVYWHLWLGKGLDLISYEGRWLDFRSVS